MATKFFKKKPIVIEAIQWDGGNTAEVLAFATGKAYHKNGEAGGCEQHYIGIQTLDGLMRASVGDYVLRGVNGEFYPCKPDIFAKTYEEVCGICHSALTTCASSGHSGCLQCETGWQQDTADIWLCPACVAQTTDTFKSAGDMPTDNIGAFIDANGESS